MLTQSVLYVEDDALSREVMALLLTYQVGLSQLTMFENSANFSTRLKTLPVPPEVILLDIHVKPLSGFEMLRLLRAEGFAQTIIIALTASVMSEEIQKLKSAGFNGVIAKPVNMDTFPAVWERILKQEPVWGVV